MKLRTSRTLGALIAVPFLLVGATAAFAADSGGRIDHVETADDAVTVLYSVPGLATGTIPDPDTISVTLDGKPVDATASPVEGSNQQVRRTSVLAIDVSKSMSGSKFAAAQAAAQAYVDSAPEDVYIGLVTFASDVTTVSDPTQDHASLVKSITSLKLTQDTHLYDGVLQSLDVVGDEGQRSILLLSDGKDTTTTDIATVLDQTKNAEVRVDVVSLDQKVDNGSPLDEIASTSGGTVTTTSDPKELAGLFTSEANDLANQLVVTFPAPSSASNGTLALSVDADGATYSDNAFVSLTASSGGPPSPTYQPADSSSFSVSKPVMLAGVAMLFVGLAVLLAYGASRAVRAEATPMQQQLSLYTVHGMKRSQRQEKQGQNGQLRESAVAMAEDFISKRDFEERLATRLDRGGLSLTAAEWLLLHAGIAVGALVVGFLLKGIIGALMFFLLGLVLPYMYLKLKESRRIKGFNAALAQTLQIIAGALQAGLSLPQAVDTVVQEGSEPVASEFRRAIVEQRLGVDIEDSLDSVADRMDSTDFKWVVMAIRIQREVGGNLSELLLTVAATLREREYLRRQVSVLSAEGRLSAFILGGLPPFFVIYLSLARPTYLAPMTASPMGWGMIVTGVVLMAVGTFWLKQAVKVVV